MISVDEQSAALASLTGTVPEYGNDLPTMVDPAAPARLAELGQADPQVTFDTLRPSCR